jgi:hypothetical protein
MHSGTGHANFFREVNRVLLGGEPPAEWGYTIFSRQSSYPTITRAIAAKSQEVVHLCQTFRAQNNPLFGSNSVKKFHLSYGREEETGPRNYGPFLILIHAVSAAIPRGMAIASTIVSTFIGFFAFPIYCGLRAERLNRNPCRWR